MKTSKRFLAMFLAFLMAFGNLSSVVAVAEGEEQAVEQVAEAPAEPAPAPAEPAPAPAEPAPAPAEPAPAEPAPAEEPAAPAEEPAAPAEEPAAPAEEPAAPAEEPAADEPSAEEPSVDEPVVDEPVAGEPVAGEPAADENSNEYASTENAAPATYTVTFKFTVDGGVQPDLEVEYVSGDKLVEPEESKPYELDGCDIEYYKDEQKTQKIDFDLDVIVVSADMTVWVDVSHPEEEPAADEPVAAPMSLDEEYGILPIAQSGNLEVTLRMTSASKDSYEVGDRLTFVITITNHRGSSNFQELGVTYSGLQGIENVRFDYMGSDFTWTTKDEGWHYSYGLLDFEHGLNPGKSTTITFDYVIKESDVNKKLNLKVGAQNGWGIQAQTSESIDNIQVKKTALKVEVKGGEKTVTYNGETQTYGDYTVTVTSKATGASIPSNVVSVELGSNYAASGKVVDEYPVNLSGAKVQLKGNNKVYTLDEKDVTVTNGKLTITKRPIKVSVEPEGDIYEDDDGSSVALTVSAGEPADKDSGLVSGHALSGTATGTVDASAAGNVVITDVTGDVKITDGEDDVTDNYAVSYSGVADIKALPTVSYVFDNSAPTGEYAQTLPETEKLRPGKQYLLPTFVPVETHDEYSNVTGTYTFEGWTLNGEKVTGGQVKKDGENDTLVGTWTYEKKEVPAYSVVYSWDGLPEEANEYSEPLPTEPTNEKTYVHNQPYDVSKTPAVGAVYKVKDQYGNVTGTYTFQGWTDPNNGKMTTEGVTIKGEWKYEAAPEESYKHFVKYVVTNPEEGPAGAVVPVDKTYAVKEPYKIADPLETVLVVEDEGGTLNEYIFDDWKDVDGNPVSGEKTMGETDVTYYGKWTKNVYTAELDVTHTWVNGRDPATGKPKSETNTKYPYGDKLEPKVTVKCNGEEIDTEEFNKKYGPIEYEYTNDYVDGESGIGDYTATAEWPNGFKSNTANFTITKRPITFSCVIPVRFDQTKETSAYADFTAETCNNYNSLYSGDYTLVAGDRLDIGNYRIEGHTAGWSYMAFFDAKNNDKPELLNLFEGPIEDGTLTPEDRNIHVYRGTEDVTENYEIGGTLTLALYDAAVNQEDLIYGQKCEDHQSIIETFPPDQSPFDLFTRSVTYYKVEGDSETRLEKAPKYVGDYRVEVTWTPIDPNYVTGFTVSDTFKITPLEITVSASDTKEYNGGTQTLDITEDNYDGKLPYDDVLTLSASVSGKDVGPYENVEVKTWNVNDTAGKDVSYNYEVKVEGSLTITPKEVTVRANNAEKAYGEIDPAFTAEVEGLVGGDGENVLTYKLDRKPGESVGTYPITPSGADVQGNYKVKYETGIFTITQPETTAFNVNVEQRDLVYGEIVKPQTTITSENEAAVKNYDVPELTYYVKNGENWVKLNETPKYVGSYRVEATWEGNKNLPKLTVEDTFQITKRPITINKTDSKVYNGEEQKLDITAADVPEGSLVYDDVLTLSASISGKDVGVYGEKEGELKGTDSLTIKDTVGKDMSGNYEVTITGTLEITPATLTVTAKVTEQYTGKEINVTFSAENVTASGFCANDHFDSFSASVSGTDVGPYETTVVTDYKIVNGEGVEINKNYSVTFTGTLEIVKNTTNVITIKADDGYKTYDGRPLTANGFTYTQGILPEGFRVEATVSGSQTNAGSSDNTVTEYHIYNEGDKDVTSSFTVETEVGTLHVNKRTVTVRTESASRNYNGEPLTADGTISGIVESDKDQVTLEVTGSQTNAGSSKNTYDIGWGNANKDNYTVREQLGTLTVNPRPVALYTEDASKFYDGEPFELTADSVKVGMARFVTGEGVDITMIGSQTDVGSSDNTFTYEAKEGTNLDNYIISTDEGTLTVTRRPVRLISEGATKEYDGTALTNEKVTEGSMGFVDGEGVTYDVTGSQTLVGRSSNTFTYVANEGTDLRNYDIATMFGALVVTDRTDKYEITVQANSDEVTYDGEDHDVSGFVNESLTFDVDGNIYKVEGLSASANGHDAGPYDVEITGTPVVKDSQGNDVTAQFTVTPVNGQLTINRRPVTLQSGTESWPYDGEAHSNHTITDLTANEEGQGMVEGEEFSFDGFPTITDHGGLSNMFTAHDNGDAKVSNYEITPEYGTLTVNPREASEYTATVSLMNWIYGDENAPVAAIDGPNAEEYGDPTIEYGYNAMHEVNGEWIEGPSFSATKLIDASSWDPYQQYSPENGGYIVKATWHDEDGNLPDIVEETHYDVYRRPIRIQTPSLAKIYDGEPAEARDAYLVGGEYNGVNYYGNLAYNDTFHFDPDSFHAQTDVTVIGASNIGDAGFNNRCDWWIEDSYSDIVAASDNPGIVKNYQILEDIGGIAVYRRPVVFQSFDLSKRYDGDPLNNFAYNGQSIAALESAGVISTGWDYNEFNDVHANGANLGQGGLIEADAEKVTVTFTGSQTLPGTYENGNRFTVNWNGVKMTNYYTGNSYGDLTIIDRDPQYVINVQPNGDSFTYNGTNQSVSGFVTLEFNVDGHTYTVEGLTAGASGTNADTYPVAVDGTAVVRDAEGNDVTSQFQVNIGKATLVIDPKTYDVTTESASKVYDGEPLTAPGRIEGLVSEDDATLVLTGSQTTEGSSANTYRVEFAEGMARNYVLGEETIGALTITQQSIEPDPDDPNAIEIDFPTNYVYDGAAHQWAPTVTDPERNNAVLAAGTDYTVSYSTEDFTNVTGTITVTITGIGNYSGTVTRTYEITPATATVTTASATRAYNGAALTAGGTISGLVAGETATVNTTSSITNQGTQANNTYNIAWGTAQARNYNVVIGTTGTLTVNPRAVTLTSGSAARAYDGTPLTNATVTVTSGSFVGNQGVNTNVTGSQTDVGTSANTFTYTMRPGTLARNYNITVVPGTLTVTAAAAGAMTANAPTNFLYDGAAHQWAPTVTGIGGAALTEGVDYTVAYSTGDYTNVTGAINVTITGIGNYSGTITRSYQITPRTVTLTSPTATRVYNGTALQSANIAVGGDGFARGEGASYNVTGSRTTVGTTSNNFSYALNANTRASNYNISQAYGSLIVTPAPLTANTPANFLYDGAAHQWTPTVTTPAGLAMVAGRDYTVTYSTGNFTDVTGAITVTITGQGNYAGTLYRTYQINPRLVTMTSPSATKDFDGTALRATDIAIGGNGFAAGEGASYNVTGSRIQAGTSRNAFTYSLNAGTDADNYTIRQFFGTLTVVAAPEIAPDVPEEPPVDITPDDTPLGGLPELPDDGYTLSEEMIIDENETPLGAGPGEHVCCILHLIIMLGALTVAVYYTHDRKRRQQREFELRAELQDQDM